MDFNTLTQNCYTPYSAQMHSCVVRDTEGRHYPGVRVENISYPLTISRIQNAVFSCLSSGGTPETIIFPDQPGSIELISYWQKEYDLQVVVDAGYTFEPAAILLPGRMEEIPLFEKLNALCSMAVAPNSDFHVAAFLEVPDGYIPGVNVECSSWELGLCAERMAISRALALGYTEFGTIYVTAPQSDYVSPCGACRQVLHEHLPAGRVILHQNDNKTMSLTTSELLPYHFSGDVLLKS